MSKKIAAVAALLLLVIGLSAASASRTSPLRERFGNCHSNLPEYLYAAYAAQLGNLDYLLFDGDSLIKGAGATLGINLTVQLVPLLVKPVSFANIGICGLQLAEMNVRDSNVPLPSHLSAPHRILVEDGGSNDLHIGMTGVRLFHDFFLPYVAARRAEGFGIIAGTLIYRDDIPPATNAERESYNNLLRASASAYSSAVADYDSIPQLRKPQAPGYSSDGTHPTTSGYSLMAAKLAPVVNRILLDRNPALAAAPF
jgi:lysophospholipase L1-like esterase